MATDAFDAFPILDTAGLAKKLKVKPCWVRNHVQPGKDDPIPHLKLGRYVRFQWGSPDLMNWLARRSKRAKKQHGGAA